MPYWERISWKNKLHLFLTLDQIYIIHVHPHSLSFQYFGLVWWNPDYQSWVPEDISTIHIAPHSLTSLPIDSAWVNIYYWFGPHLQDNNHPCYLFCNQSRLFVLTPLVMDHQSHYFTTTFRLFTLLLLNQNYPFFDNI